MDPPVLINVGIEPAPPQVVIAYFSKLQIDYSYSNCIHVAIV